MTNTNNKQVRASDKKGPRDGIPKPSCPNKSPDTANLISDNVSQGSISDSWTVVPRPLVPNENPNNSASDDASQGSVSDTWSLISEMSPITSSRFRRVRPLPDPRILIVMGNAIAAFSFFISCTVVSKVAAAIPAAIPRNYAPDQPPSHEGSNTLLLVVASLIFLTLDKIADSTLFKILMDKLYRWLEKRNKNTRLYRAYQEAKTVLSSTTAETEPVPISEVNIAPAEQEPRPNIFLFYATLYYFMVEDLSRRITVTPIYTIFQMIAFSSFLLPKIADISLSYRMGVSALVMVAHTLKNSHSSAREILSEDKSHITADTTESTQPSLLERARDIVEEAKRRKEIYSGPLREAALRGTREAGEALDDMSLGFTSVGTMGSDPFSEVDLPIEHPTNSLPDLDPQLARFVDALQVTSGRAVLSFITRLFTAPKWSADSRLCLLAHASNFADLVGTLTLLHGPKIKLLLRLAQREARSLGANFSLEADDPDEKESFIHDVASGVEKIKHFEESVVGATCSSVLALVCTMPILLQEYFDADSWIKAWKVALKGFKVSGASISSILKSFLTMYRTCLCAGTTVSPRTVISTMFSPDDFFSEYMACWTLHKAYMEGTQPLPSKDVEAVQNRFARLVKKAKSRVSSTSTPAEIARFKECQNMFDDLMCKAAVSGTRISPYFFAFDGLPGTAKSTFTRAIAPLLHEWIGKRDLMEIAEIDIVKEFDDDTLNSTTMGIIDDNGNIQIKFRSNTLSGMLLRLGQSKAMMINKSAVEQKGKHYYNFDFVAVLDNKWKRGIDEELMEPMAGYRRLGMSAEVRVKPEYQNVSGGLDKDKAIGANPFGGCQMFRPYKIVRKGNGPIEQHQLLSENDGWLDGYDFLAFLREDILNHRESERVRIAAEEDAQNLPLCNICQVTPSKYCKCGENMMDAMDGSDSVTRESLVELMRDRLTATRTYADSSIEAAVVWTVVNARIFALNKVRVTRVADLLLSTGLLEAVFVLTLALSLGAAYELRSPQSFFYLLLSVFSFSLVRYLAKQWRRFMRSSPLELCSASLDAARYWTSRTINVNTVFTATGVIMALPVLWTALVRLFPVHQTKESMETDEEDEETPIVSDVKHEEQIKETPIWAIPKHVPPAGSHKSATIVSEDLNRLVIRNCRQCRFQILGEVSVHQQNVFMINSRIGVTASHVTFKDGELHPFQIWPKGENAAGVHKISKLQMYLVPDSDLLFIYFNNPFGHLKDLSDYIIENTPPKLTLNKLMLADGHLDVEPCHAVLKHTSYMLHGEWNISREMYSVTSSRTKTALGQCGIPYTTLGKHSVVAAIHVAGDKNFSGTAHPILRSHYLQARDYFESNGLHYLEPTFPALKAGKQVAECGPNEKHPVFFQSADVPRHLEIAGWRPAWHSPRSEIHYNEFLEEAKLHMKLRFTKSKPRFRWREGAHRVLSESTIIRRVGDIALLRSTLSMIKEDIIVPAVAKFKIENDHEWTSRPLTLKEIAAGIPGTPIGSMDQSKSSGIGGKKAAYVVGELEERDFLPEVYQDIEVAERCLSARQNPSFAPTAFLKDELLGHGKTVRTVFNAPLHIYILSMKYLRLALEVITQQNAAFCTAIGLDPVGTDWYGFCEPFSQDKFQGNAFDLDYRNFDCTQGFFTRSFASEILHMILEEFPWSDEELIMAKRVLVAMDDCPVDLFGCLMYIPNLMMSGYLYTAHRNGLITILMFYYDLLRFSKRCGKSYSFIDHVVLRTLGDDLIAAVSTELRRAGWTQDHFVESCAHWGMSVTTANKDMNFYFKFFEDCEFLKRYYNYQDDIKRNVFVADPKSYLNPFIGNVRGKDWEPHLYYADIAEAALREAFFGGELSYNSILQRLRDYYDHVPLAKPPCLSWEYWDLVEMYHDPEKEQPQLFPETQQGIVLLCTYDMLPHQEGESGESEEIDQVVLQQIEATVEESPVENHTLDRSRMPISHNSIPEEVLHRRVILQTIAVWDETAPPTHIPVFKAMLEQDVYRDRLKNIAFVAATVEVTIEVIAPSTSAGIALVSIIHFPDTLALPDATSADLALMSQRDSMMIRVGGDTTVFKMEIPFMYPENAVNPFDVDSLQILPGIMISCVTPLISSVEVQHSVMFKVYGSFKSITAFGATATRSPSGQYAESGGHCFPPESSHSAETEVISNALKKVSQVAKAASKVPGMEQLATASEIANGASKVAAYFGFSKPIALKGIGTPGETFPNGMGTCDANTLTVNPHNEVALAPPGWERDELLFSSLISRWTIISRHDISTQDYGDEIVSFNVTPSIVVEGQPAACSGPALFTQYWRGSMEFEVTIACPTLLSVKLAVFYDPLGGNHSDLLGAPQTVQEDYLDHVILDSSNQQSAIIRVGFSVPSAALETVPRPTPRTTAQKHQSGLFSHSTLGGATSVAVLNSHWNDPSQYRSAFHNGRLIVRVHDRVRGGFSPPSIPVIIRARAGPDMQFGAYRGTLPSGISTGSLPSLPTSAGSISLQDCLKPTDPSVLTCETLALTPGPVPSPVTQAPAATSNPTTLSPTTVAPTTAAPVATPAPTTNAPVTSAPTTTAPTTASPTTSAPVTASPTTVVPTAADACAAGKYYLSRYLWGTTIQVGTAMSHNDTSAKIRFIATTPYEEFSLWGPTWCEGAVTLVISNVGTEIELVDVLGNVYTHAPAAVNTNRTVLFDPAAVGQTTPPYNVNVRMRIATPGAEVWIVGWYPDGVPFELNDQVLVPKRCLSDNVVYQPVGGGAITSDAGTVAATTDEFGVERYGYVAPAGKAFVMILGNVPDTKVFCTVEAYGTVKIYSSNWSVKLNTSLNRWRRHTFLVDSIGGEFFVETPTSGGYPVACVRYVSMITETPANQTHCTHVHAFPASRRSLLGSIKGYVNSSLTAETLVEEMKTTSPTGFHLGGPIDDSEYFSRVVTGEVLASFRPLLKVPHQVRTYQPPAGVVDSFVVTQLYTDGDSSLRATLYWFLHNSFCLLRGSVISHYNVIGDGAIEVSRGFLPSDGAFQPAAAGVSLTDSRVNPLLSVRHQGQRPYLYTVAGGREDNPLDQKLLRVYSWSGAVLTIKEYRSTGEDFNFSQFRGFARLY